ncbi:hypothetical protein JVT61DRAFT_5329 [Boletus reticuloceps]|uniref:Uncharacterized protein n=1 Tax=Boletus reticuloceps TaxID=495285 RepID=A0A8I2YYS4_9AGAM|nr:hypothetical protein JVT61DRAFT_5329 [Boletus reticuloceps]
MDVPLRKVTAKVDFKAGNTFVRSQSRSRPASPTSQSPTLSLPPFHPKAKVSSNATLRKLSSASSLSAFHSNVSAPVRSRPGSPLRPSRMLPSGSEPSSSPKARVTAKPTSRSGISPVRTNPGSLEPRQRALTAASAKLKLLPSEERPRSGSVIALHHALSISDLNTSSSPTSPLLSHSAEAPLANTRRTNTPPVLAPIKIKSKVTNFVKSASVNGGDLTSRSLSPPYATTRPIHTRSRAPSIATFSLNDSPPSAFYPITTASPAANPHRYTPQRPLSPARFYTPPTPSNEPHPAKKLPPVPKVDPASVPLPPYSPPISALSLSSKSSVSKTSVSPNSDHTVDNHISSAVSHIRRRSSERIGQANPFFSQAEIKAQTRRDRSRSKERSPRDLVSQGDSDVESEGSERQLKAEAKTNRKIADLEITNRSLLAINASLETTKNRQAKEIRDLRRKLRESRLVLPPPTFKAVKSALDDDDDDDDNDNDNGDNDSDVEEGEDETFQRIRGLIDNLIESGKRALETRPEDFRANLATKVLNADELRSWRDFGHHTSIRNSFMDKQDADDVHSRLSPVLVAIPDSGCTSLMESDGELASDSRSSSLPPITITHSL